MFTSMRLCTSHACVLMIRIRSEKFHSSHIIVSEMRGESIRIIMTPYFRICSSDSGLGNYDVYTFYLPNKTKRSSEC